MIIITNIIIVILDYLGPTMINGLSEVFFNVFSFRVALLRIYCVHTRPHALIYACYRVYLFICFFFFSYADNTEIDFGHDARARPPISH